MIGKQLVDIVATQQLPGGSEPARGVGRLTLDTNLEADSRGKFVH